jgi:hypothetical protein
MGWVILSPKCTCFSDPCSCYCSDATTRSLTYEEVALKEIDEKFDLWKLSSFPGSGRSVGAVMKMAIALCSYRQCDLTETILQECIDNFLSFHNDLKNEGAPEDWDDNMK